MSNPTAKSSTAAYDVTDLRDLTAAERAEVRATEDGRNARSTDHFAQYLVQGQVDRDRSYICTVLLPTIGAPVRVACNCKSGAHRAHVDVPCRHAGAVVKRLEREGLAVRSETLRCSVSTEKAVRVVRDRLDAELEDFRNSAEYKSVFG